MMHPSSSLSGRARTMGRGVSRSSGPARAARAGASTPPSRAATSASEVRFERGVRLVGQGFSHLRTSASSGARGSVVTLQWPRVARSGAATYPSVRASSPVRSSSCPSAVAVRAIAGRMGTRTGSPCRRKSTSSRTRASASRSPRASWAPSRAPRRAYSCAAVSAPLWQATNRPWRRSKMASIQWPRSGAACCVRSHRCA